MKIGLIGIGDIAMKAYLPVVSRIKDVELYLSSRNKSILEDVKAEYKHLNIVETVDDLISKEIDAVMIHTSTQVHFELCKKFLSKGIPVYIDKPISMDILEVRELFKIAKEKNVLFRTGFNRRYSTWVKEMSSLGRPDAIIYQKNRFDWPGETKDYIFVDFIHVIDTFRYLMQEEVISVEAKGLVKNDEMYSLHVFLKGKHVSVSALMYRDSGKSEEKIEVMWPNHKILVNDLNDKIEYYDKLEVHHKHNDWHPVLDRRGFDGLIAEFIADVNNGGNYLLSDDDALKTHELCEEIYNLVK